MTSRMTCRLLLGALLILLPAMPVFAKSTPEAQQWLEKMVAIYDHGPFKVDYSADIDMSSLGQPMSGSLEGKLVQADRNHSRIELDFNMATPPGMPGLPEGGMKMSVLVINDGTTLWTEMDNPMLGGRQISKISLAEVEELGQSMGGMGLSPTSMDPVAQLENMTKTMDFEVLEKSAGTVTLKGKLTEEARGQMGMLGAAPGIDAFIFEIDEKTGFPVEVRAAGEAPFITMNFRNLEFVKASSLADDLFTYSPPEGMPVMDLGQMMRSQAAATQ